MSAILWLACITMLDTILLLHLKLDLVIENRQKKNILMKYFGGVGYCLFDAETSTFEFEWFDNHF